MPAKYRRPLLLVAGALLVTAAAVPIAVGSASAQDEPSGPSSGAQPRIVGGDEASLSDHPYAVYLTDSGGNQYCGAVIVSSSAVATAAHCAKAIAASDTRVVAGREDKRTDDGIVLAVSKVWIDPDFSDPTKGDDIAVLTVRGQLPYRPAKVADSSDRSSYDTGTQATVLGWGGCPTAARAPTPCAAWWSRWSATPRARRPTTRTTRRAWSARATRTAARTPARATPAARWSSATR